MSKKIEAPDITSNGCCGNPSQCWEPCGDLGKSLSHVRVSSEKRKKAVRDVVDRHSKTRKETP